MVGASNSWHPTTIHCFLVWVLTASRGLELGIDPGIATSTGPRVCWDSVKVEPMGEIPAVLWMELEMDLRVGKERDRMMKKVWRWLCKNSVLVRKKVGYVLEREALVEVEWGLPMSIGSTNG
eukprot:Em0014g914a